MNCSSPAGVHSSILPMMHLHSLQLLTNQSREKWSRTSSKNVFYRPSANVSVQLEIHRVQLNFQMLRCLTYSPASEFSGVWLPVVGQEHKKKKQKKEKQQCKVVHNIHKTSKNKFCCEINLTFSLTKLLVTEPVIYCSRVSTPLKSKYPMIRICDVKTFLNQNLEWSWKSSTAAAACVDLGCWFTSDFSE